MDIAEAKKALRKAAANLLAHKEGANKRIATLEKQQAELREGAERARAAGEAELEAEARAALETTEARLATDRELLSTLERDYADSMRELEELDAANSDAERARLVSAVNDLVGGDPVLESFGDRALENARRGIYELEARVELDRELSAERAQEQDLSQRLAALDEVDADTAARAELAKLKAQRRTSNLPEAPDDTADDEGPAAKPKKKRTL